MKPFIPDKETLRNLVTNAIVLDLETTLNSESNFSGSPHDPNNYIVAAASCGVGFGPDYPKDSLATPFKPWKQASTMPEPEDRDHGYLTYGNGDLPGLESVNQFVGVHVERIARGPVLYVGHNIAFDLQYLQNHSGRPEHVKWENILVWDTMLAEYYLTGQEQTMPSLEKACSNHGIDFTKDDEVTEQFKLGIGSDRINPVVLMEYLSLDIQSTNALFMAQHDAVHKNAGVLGLRYLIGLMTARAATARAECFGLHVDLQSFNKHKNDLQIKYDSNKAALTTYMQTHLPADIAAEITPTSSQQVGVVLYGGDVKCEFREFIKDEDGNQVYYKSGQKKGEPKTRRGTEIYTAPRNPHVKRALTANPLHTYALDTSEKTLKDLLSDIQTSRLTRDVAPIEQFISALLDFRSLHKELTTSYEGLKKHFRYNINQDAAYIHPSYNHAITRTKRLSSSSPNMQNVSNKEVKEDNE